MNDSWEQLDLGRHDAATTLARQVLKTQPDTIDAYVLLALAGAVTAEAIELLTEAVRIADRIGKPRDDGTIDAEGIYNRDAHVRALNNLARSLWADGRPDQRAGALRHARRALRMDCYDRAGTRLLLMAWEAAAGNWPAAKRLALRYRRELRTEIRYWLALHAFRDGSNEANALLATAIATNPHVVSALQERLRSLHMAERSYAFGSPEEATHYATEATDGWKATRGALASLAAAKV
jgi:tetratricopeptide (TPR) repeat protein